MYICGLAQCVARERELVWIEAQTAEVLAHDQKGVMRLATLLAEAGTMGG